MGGNGEPSFQFYTGITFSSALGCSILGLKLQRVSLFLPQTRLEEFAGYGALREHVQTVHFAFLLVIGDHFHK